MDTHPGQPTTSPSPLEVVRDELLADDAGGDRWPDATKVLRDIAQSAAEASRADLSQLADLMASLLAIACSLESSACDNESTSLVDFVREGLPILQAGLDDCDGASEEMEQLTRTALSRWGDCLELMDDRTVDDAFWEAASEPVSADEDETPLPEPGQLGVILGSLTSLAQVDSGSPQPDVTTECQSSQDDFDPQLPTTTPSGALSREVVIDDQLVLDPEIREAYLDDARRCLASIEASVLAFESDPNNRQPLQQVCRELHTLKGASASVGLSKMAQFLHEVEDGLQRTCDHSVPVEIESILKCVDVVRRQMQQCNAKPSKTDNDATTPSEAPTARDSFVDATASLQDSVRVKSAQLDRLMDMLAELVMLRNRRESRVEQLKEIHGELTRCVSRVRAFDDRLGPGASHNAMLESRNVRAELARRRVSSLTEIANDLLELGRSLRELYEPVADENLAISRFIRHFRQELMQLRRVPLSGLFRRLQRAARDAARTENKRAQLVVVGEEVGLERSIQEQLYEPLLHMVRNAVSHGVESESARVAAGKDPVGTVTLEAHGGSNLLVVTVRDDGKGLDYDALRRRGIEMGLISPNRATTRSELARLIFHAGFSTRRDANAVSGRGVGMDVVASTLERMHSWVEVDSTPGEGTSVRLLIPLHSVIEHVMVFRSGGQEFGMPTQFVQSAGPWEAEKSVDFPVLNFAELCPGLKVVRGASQQCIVMAQGWQPTEAGAVSAESGPDARRTSERRLGLLVDEIVGPEEVVVRPLPGLLKNQRLFSGVTLSGTGDIMLLFDSQRLLERGVRLAKAHAKPGGDITDQLHGSEAERPRYRVLVVDDSRSSRRALVDYLEPRGWAVDEAGDGLQALKILRAERYDLVLTDLEMPQLGGLELVRDLRANEETREIPVIMVSSRDDEVFRIEAAQLGVMAYLTKPVSERNLSDVLRRLPILSKGNDS